MRAFYFGCIDRIGHYMFDATGRNTKEADAFTYNNPWGTQVDGGLAPNGPQVEGLALVHQKGGWTALSLWDRSVDGRPGSTSTFLAEGKLTFNEMISFAGTTFPQVVRRFSFKIVDAAVPR